MHAAEPSKTAQSDKFSDQHIRECSQHKHLLWQCHLNSADSDRVKLTSMPVSIHGIRSCCSQIVEQAETMTTGGIIGTGYHPSWACMMPRGPDCTESIAYLQSCSIVWIHIPSWYFV